MDPIVFAKEAARMLDCADGRTLSRRCAERGVPVFSFERSKSRFVVRALLEAARWGKVVQYLQVRYNDRWVEAFEACLNNDVVRIVELESSPTGIDGSKHRDRTTGAREQAWLTKTYQDLQSKRWSNRSTSPKRNNSNV